MANTVQEMAFPSQLVLAGQYMAKNLRQYQKKSSLLREGFSMCYKILYERSINDAASGGASWRDRFADTASGAGRATTGGEVRA